MLDSHESRSFQLSVLSRAEGVRLTIGKLDSESEVRTDNRELRMKTEN